MTLSRAPRPLRSIAAHVAALTVIEWLVSLALGAMLADAIAAPLRAHRAGGDAIAAEHGRIAIELFVTRLAELRSGAATVVIVAVLYGLIVVPLHGVMPALVVCEKDNPWGRSVARTPSLVAIALVHGALLVTLGLSARSALTASIHRALSANPGPFLSVTYAIIAVALLTVVALRSLFALARAAAVLDHDARPSLALAFEALRARPFTIVLSRAALELASLALALLAALSPAPLTTLAALAAHGARIALELVWLARCAGHANFTASTRENH